MKLSKHADRTEKELGLRAEDIHKWIDGFFDHETFIEFFKSGQKNGFDPYSHRKFRHCKEALEDAYEEFKGKYTKEQIKAVFESHLRDDYDGYIPNRDDFDNGRFSERYHEFTELNDNEKILSNIELNEYFKGKSYKKSKIKKKRFFTNFYLNIVIPAILVILFFLLSIFIVIIPLVHNDMMDNKKEMVRELTRTATSIIHRYIEQEEKGFLSRKEAQKKASSEMNELRYGKEMKDYFWITDMHPRMIMHPYRKDLIGQDLSNYTDNNDPSGKKLFVEFVQLVKKNNDGFLKYLWQWKDDSTKLVPKLSYVKAIPEWNWIVGTGIYINDIEEELDLLEKNLILAFLLITLIIFVIILYLVKHSHNIENDRQRTEEGLIEAKERYRALVESSNEGYILSVDGKNIYSNATIQRLLGYNEQELIDSKIWNLILPGNNINKEAREKINLALKGIHSNRIVEAQMFTKNGSILDITISTSKIFLSNKNSSVITIRKIKSNKTIFERNIFKKEQKYIEKIEYIISEIKNSKTTGHIIHTVNELPLIIREMLEHKKHPNALRQAICNVFEEVMIKAIKISLKESSELMPKFAFLILGSNARREMTLFSDQDNALVFENLDTSKTEKLRRFLLHFAVDVCKILDKAGYHYCPGGIMAINPRFCLSIKEWKDRFVQRINYPEPNAIKEINTIFDIDFIYGNKEIANDIENHMLETANKNSEFLLFHARNCLTYQIPLTTFGSIRTEKQGSLETLNLKNCIYPIVNFARLYALKYEIKETGTVDRLMGLNKIGILKDESLKNIISAFDHLWKLRFFNQIICHDDLQIVNDILDLSMISEEENKKLCKTLENVSLMQNKLSYDFLGIAQDNI